MVTYGTTSAPYLAQRPLKQLSYDEENKFPVAAPVFGSNFYVDDALSGAETLEECINEIYDFSRPNETKTLGVSWDPVKDTFSFKVDVIPRDSYTKRSVLSTIARLFDPFGLAVPVVAKAKMFMQKLWRLSIDWKDPLPNKVYHEWHQLLIRLESLNSINIKRRVVIENLSIEIHGFSDASERCYGAAVYCKSKNNSGVTLVRFISSNSRVSPIKCLTIPRLELCVAILLSKLVKRVIDALKLDSVKVYL
ncbi:uncharacterized protein TNCV_897991 [Trichonephila clavipes]|nr:uncharacterized protein TNCV_897991 [Trichonephila clavipes]